MSLILSHNTARLFHRLPNCPHPEACLPAEQAELRSGPVDMSLVERARHVLVAHGVPPEALDSIDVLVRSATDRRRSHGVHAHVWGCPVPANSLIRLERGIYVSDVLFCAQQTACEFGELGLIEYLMELCGCYSLPLGDEGFPARSQLVTPDGLRTWMQAASGQHGANRLRRALPFIRAGARSPLETAFFMMLLMPRRLGGMDMRELELAWRIEVTDEARALTRRGHFECDAYLPCARLDIEYNGLLHETEEQAAIDVERANALDAMGYGMMTVTRHAFFDQKAFLRLMRAIERKAGRRTDRLRTDFLAKQEELRQFVLRRYLKTADRAV